MKKYLLFYYKGFYPSGAFNDYVDSFETPDEVFDYIQSLPSSLQEDVRGGCLEFQILNTENFSLLTLDDIDNISDILSAQRYIPVEKSWYFNDEVEVYQFKDELNKWQ